MRKLSGLSIKAPGTLNLQWALPFMALAINLVSTTKPGILSLPFLSLFLLCILFFCLWIASVRRESRGERVIGTAFVIPSICTLLYGAVFLLFIKDPKQAIRLTTFPLSMHIVLFSYLLIYFNLHDFGRFGIMKILRVILMFFWGYDFIAITHQCYLDMEWIRELSSGIYGFILPYGRNGITGNNNWITVGITFYLGSLFIINWSKDVPCKTWNPFTAQELKMTSAVVAFGSILFSALLYSYANEMKTVSFIIVLLLLATDIYTMLLCNSQNIHKLVCRKIIQILEVHNIRCSMTGTEQTEGVPFISTGSTISSRIISFSQSIAAIAKVIIVSNESISFKMNRTMDLINGIAKCIPNEEQPAIQTIGFVFGFSFFPRSLSKKSEKISSLYNELDNQLNNPTETTPENQKSLYAAIRYGLIFGLKHLSKNMGNKDIKMLADKKMEEVDEFIERNIDPYLSEFYKSEKERLESSEQDIQTQDDEWYLMQIIEMGL